MGAIEPRAVSDPAVGSVAYKLALVAAGKVDATWTLVHKNEWDVAAGAALLQFAQGRVPSQKTQPGLGRSEFFERLCPLLKLILTGY